MGIKLTDIVNTGKRKGSEALMLVRYPRQVLTRWGRRGAQKVYEQAEIGSKDSPDRNRSLGSKPFAGRGSRSRLHRSKNCRLDHHRFLRPVSEPEESQSKHFLKSRWGKYFYYSDDQEKEDQSFRLYEGQAEGSGESVLIKEFIVSESVYRRADIHERFQIFEQLVNLNRKVSHSPDFRLVRWVDAVCDRPQRRCYLITQPPAESQTLEAYLAELESQPSKPLEGQSDCRMAAAQIREVLDQVLETLTFLHDACKIQFSSLHAEKEVKGIPHGNINLSSLYILSLDNPAYSRNDQFFIYVSDLALWEHLFVSPGRGSLYSIQPDGLVNLKRLEELKLKDLRDLCRVACQLAVAQFAPEGELEDLLADDLWRELNDEPLQKFLQQLSTGTPNSVRAALEELRTLPYPEEADSQELAPVTPEADPSEADGPWQVPTGALLLAAVVGLLAGGGLVWRMGIDNLLARSGPQSAPQAEQTPEPIRLNCEASVYIQASSAWEPALSQSVGQLRRVAETGTALGHTQPPTAFQRLLEQADCQLGTVSSVAPVTRPYEDVFAQVQAENTTVGLISTAAAGATLEESSVTFAPVAYDGLAVFVPFGDPYRSRDSVGKLGQTVNMGELRQLYTGGSYTPTFRGQAIKLFFPDDPAAIALFKVLVLNSDVQLIDRFDRLHRQAIARDARRYPSPQSGELVGSVIRNNIYEKMLHEFETEGVIGVGFDRLSTMFNQCSVYPLAVSPSQASRRRRRQSSAVQPLRQAGGEPIRPTTDLCNAKGSYWVEVSRAYPLAVELGLLFSPGSTQGDNLARLLGTAQSQHLLSEVGLVPHMPMPQIWSQLRAGEP